MVISLSSLLVRFGRVVFVEIVPTFIVPVGIVVLWLYLLGPNVAKTIAGLLIVHLLFGSLSL